MTDRGRQLLVSLYPIVIDIVVPIVLYYAGRFIGLPNFVALTVAGVVSGLVALFEVIRDRKGKATAVLVFLMFVLSIALVFVIHNAKIILLKPSIYTEAGGCTFSSRRLDGRSSWTMSNPS